MAMAVVLSTLGVLVAVSMPISEYLLFGLVRVGWVFIPAPWLQWATRVFYCRRRIIVRVVPHMLTCALAEFASPAQAQLVETTTRSKLLRLAAMPVPDASYAQVMTGTELAVKVVASSEAFFDAPLGRVT
jgi:hypothetical protein